MDFLMETQLRESPQILTGVDDTEWPCISLYVALHDSSTVGCSIDNESYLPRVR